MTEIVPVKMSFPCTCVCVYMCVSVWAVCVFSGEKTKWGMEIEVKEEKSKNYAYVWADCMCGWQAGRLWGIHMFSFFPLTHTHTDLHIEWGGVLAWL